MSGTGRLFKRGQTWWIDFSYRGRRYRKSSGSSRKSDAQALLQEQLGLASQGKIGGPNDDQVTFEDLVAGIESDYRLKSRKSSDRLKNSLDHLRDAFGLDKAVEISTTRVQRYIATRMEEGAAPSTVQKEMAALKRMFRLSEQSGHLSQIPHIPVPQPRNTRTNFIDEGDLERLVGALPEHLRPVIQFAAVTGWRLAEITNLKWAQVDTDVRVVRLSPGTTKNDEGREVPYGVLPELVTVIEGQRRYTDAIQRNRAQIVPWVFHRNGKRLSDFRGACESRVSVREYPEHGSTISAEPLSATWNGLEFPDPSP
jgi:integrase